MVRGLRVNGDADLAVHRDPAAALEAPVAAIVANRGVRVIAAENRGHGAATGVSQEIFPTDELR